MNYIWNGLVFINHKTIEDIDELSFCCSGCKGLCPYFNDALWYGNTIEGQMVDVGGAIYFYLRNHPQCKIKYLTSTHHIKPERNNLEYLPKPILDKYDCEFAYEIVNQTFLHYGSGSNWKRQSAEYHARKTKLTYEFIRGAIEGRIEMPARPCKGKYRDPEFRLSQYANSLRYFINRTLARRRDVVEVGK